LLDWVLKRITNLANKIRITRKGFGGLQKSLARVKVCKENLIRRMKRIEF
jgi:hypothetical protein